MAVGLLSKALSTMAVLVLLHHAATAMPPGGRTFQLDTDGPNTAEPNTAEQNTAEPNTVEPNTLALNAVEPNMDEVNDDSPIMYEVNMDEPNRGDLGTGDKAETQVGRLTTRDPTPDTNTGDKKSWIASSLRRTLTKTIKSMNPSRFSTRQKSILNAPSRKALDKSDTKRKELHRKLTDRRRSSSSASLGGSFTGRNSFGDGSLVETSNSSRGAKSPDRSPSLDGKSPGGTRVRDNRSSYPSWSFTKKVSSKSSSVKVEGRTGGDEAGEIVVSVG